MSPLLTDLGGESNGKEPQRVRAYIPTKSQGERSKTATRKSPKKGSENHQKKENWRDTIKP
jgi:hypothetical protein